MKDVEVRVTPYTKDLQKWVFLNSGFVWPEGAFSVCLRLDGVLFSVLTVTENNAMRYVSTSPHSGWEDADAFRAHCKGLLFDAVFERVDEVWGDQDPNNKRAAAMAERSMGKPPVVNPQGGLMWTFSKEEWQRLKPK
jgi:hypothetical protein